MIQTHFVFIDNVLKFIFVQKNYFNIIVVKEHKYCTLEKYKKLFLFLKKSFNSLFRDWEKKKEIFFFISVKKIGAKLIKKSVDKEEREREI